VLNSTTIVVDLETVSHVLTSLLHLQPVVESTVVGAIPKLITKTKLKERDVLISEIIHGTAEMSSILSSVLLDGSVTQSKANALLESQVKAMLLTLLVTFSAVIHQHHQ